MRKFPFLTMLGCIVLFWLALIFVFDIPQYLLPSPSAVVSSIFSQPKLFWDGFIVTLVEVLLGFIIANIASACIAFFIAIHRGSQSYVMPLAIILKTIPVIALAPLLILWLGSGIAPKVATAALICFFPSLVNTLAGINSINKDYLDLFKLYSASKRQLVRRLYLPFSLPFIFSSLKISSSLAVVGALVGEFLGANNGLGFLIITSYYSLNTSTVFAAVLLSSGLGVGLYYAIEAVESRAVKWKY